MTSRRYARTRTSDGRSAVAVLKVTHEATAMSKLKVGWREACQSISIALTDPVGRRGGGEGEKRQKVHFPSCHGRNVEKQSSWGWDGRYGTVAPGIGSAPNGSFGQTTRNIELNWLKEETALEKAAFLLSVESRVQTDTQLSSH